MEYKEYDYILKLRRKNRLYELTLLLIGITLLIASRFILRDYDKLIACQREYYNLRVNLERITTHPPEVKPEIETQLLFQRGKEI